MSKAYDSIQAKRAETTARETPDRPPQTLARRKPVQALDAQSTKRAFRSTFGNPSGTRLSCRS